MTTSHHIRCGDCPHLIRERWPGGRIATRCGSPESPWAPIKRVLAVMPDITSDPGTSTVRQRWCHDKTEKEQIGDRPLSRQRRQLPLQGSRIERR